MVTIYNTTLSATSQRHFSDGLGGVNPKTIWNKGHTRDKTLAEGATRNAL